MTSRLFEIARGGRGGGPRETGGPQRMPAPPGISATAGAAATQERCDLCGEPVGPRHRHLLDLESRGLLCACRACALLFDRGAAGGEHYRLVPDRRLLLEGFRLDDALWDALRIPVDMAFFFHSSAAGRVVAYYPGPMGATESLLELEDWQRLEEENPVLRELEPDVEALLVNRARGAHEHWIVGLDECYSLAGLMRTRWKGLGGGTEVWREIDGFFAGLRKGARIAGNEQREAAWPS
jgi:hypothetical protein